MDGSSAGVFVLTWEDLDGSPRSRELDGETVSIGRRPDCDVRFGFEDVSRTHCRLERQDGHWRILDDGSLAGTHVNAERVTAPRRLVPGDVIRLGEHGLVQMVFRRRAELAETPEQAKGATAEGVQVPVMLALMRQMSATLDVDDVIGLSLDGALRLTGLTSGTAFLQDGKRLVVRVQRGKEAKPSSAGLAAVRQAIRGCTTIVDERQDCVAVPLRTFEGDRRGADTGVHRAAGALLLEGPGRGAPDLRPATLNLVQVAGDLAAVHLAHALAHERATTDALTGLRNRGWFDQALARQVSLCARNGLSFGLALADIDHFKRVNDVHGHQAGDAVLADVARRVKDALRGRGVACRYGGEEIAVLLPGLDVGDAVKAMEDVRKATSRSPVVQPRSERPGIRVTISAGVAALVPTADMPQHLLVEAADLALYRAKEAGRDRVMTGIPGQEGASAGA